MSIFSRVNFLSLEEEQDGDAGIGIGDLGRALVIWSGMNFQICAHISVAQAATAFNTTDAVIREAINAADWISYVGDESDPERQFIELDGE
jgi:hypothetical protein